MKHKAIKLTLFAIVLVAAVAVSLDLWDSQAAKLQSFSYRHRVTVTDHATGKILWPTVSLPGTSNADAFPQPAGVTALEDGSVLITGEGSEPRRWVFSHEGYDPVPLRIGRDSVASYDVQIKLSRTK